MSLCTNLTDIGLAIADIFGVTSEQRHDASMYARAIASRGFCHVTVSASNGVLYLTYETAHVSVTYRAEKDERHVRCSTRWGNGWDSTFSVPVRCYGLVAAMLLAGD